LLAPVVEASGLLVADAELAVASAVTEIDVDEGFGVGLLGGPVADEGSEVGSLAGL